MPNGHSQSQQGKWSAKHCQFYANEFSFHLDKGECERNLSSVTRKKTEREQLEGILYSIVKSGNGGSSRSATGRRTTAFPIEGDLPEPTEEDLNRWFMIIENEQGQPQPEMVEVSLAGDLADEDCEEQ